MLSLGHTKDVKLKEVDDDTIFVIKSLKNREKAKLLKLCQTFSDDKENVEETAEESMDSIIEVLKLGIKGLKNIEIGGVKKDYLDATDDIIDSLPSELYEPLLNEITDFNKPSEQEIKN